MSKFNETPDYPNKRDIAKEFLINFRYLKEEYKKDPNAVNSKYKLDFFTKIAARAFILIQTRKIQDTSAASKYFEYDQFLKKLKADKFEKGQLAGEEDIQTAEKFLEYIILELEK